ncbi:maleylpyruvate isomerase family mycothiol-dependent enzyme [Cryptosporangium aurantiacum]|uniref:maleylpyruvate isomerase family mycothiol-dependent enzyme n=1 Tax=Cryptosporangium aurantiacum TaxID=134849 RepID=UPI0009348EFE|nr:maleylpyruvate isomerase family mycothiol-dependent enzyme [Cryptosporangium aurantiacum]
MTTSTYDLPAAVANVPLAQERFAGTLATLTDSDLREPSVLPGWTRGHVIAHVARGAEAMVRLIDGVLTQRPAEAYPGGPAVRDAEIELGAQSGANELMDEVYETNLKIVYAFARMTAPTWGRQVQFPTGAYPANRCAWSRWREVEIHHVDLGLDVYTIESWPDEFVACHLPHELAKLPGRLPPGTAVQVGPSRFGTGEVVATIDGPDSAVLAWVLGRVGLAAPALATTGNLPELPPWS